MRIETCYFCSRPAYPSKGMTFCRNDGRAFRFCRSKCLKNFKMKRNPRKIKWTKAFRAAAGKEMTVDTTLQFAARRHVPMRYDREHHELTVRAMARISEIRARRERAFYLRRLRGKRYQQLSEARRLVANNEHLLPRLRGSEKRRLREVLGENADAEIAKIEASLVGNKNMLEPLVLGNVDTNDLARQEQKVARKQRKKAKIMLTTDGQEVVETAEDNDGWDGIEDDGGDAMEVDAM